MERLRRTSAENTRTCTVAPRQSPLWQEWNPRGRHYGSRSCSTPAPFLPEDRPYAGLPPLTWLSPNGSQYGCDSESVKTYWLKHAHTHGPACYIHVCIKQKRYWILPARCVSTAITEPFLACVTVNHASGIMNPTVAKRVKMKKKCCIIK